MRLLIRAIRTVKGQAIWLFMTFGTMLLLTLANQVEMLSLGVLSNSGADFFSLFQAKEQEQNKKITLEMVESKWDSISKGKPYITKEDAVYYLGKHDENPLARLMHEFKKGLGLHGGNLKALVILLMLVACFKALCLFGSRYTAQVLSIKISQHLRTLYFMHIQTLPMSFYQKYNIGSLSSRVATDASQIARSLNSCLTNYVLTPFTAISSLGACIYFSWQLTLVVFVGLPLIIIPMMFITRKVKNVSRELQINQENFASVLIDFLSGIQTVKMFAMETFSLQKYQEQNDQMAHLETKTAKYDLLVRPILHMVTTFCLAAVLIFGLYILKLSVSELFVFCGFLHLFYEPIRKFADENSNIQKGIVAAERLFEVLEISPQIEVTEDPIELTGFQDKIEFDHVWFGYEDSWILQDVSFTIYKGETVAIVGQTGSGKSTILSLLPRLYDIQKGEIRIDGVNINKFSLESLRKQMAFVSQKPFLFFDTVIANISYGTKLAKESVIQAAKQAYAHEFISKLPKQYDTHLAETGKNLSGGQQQRLAVARALAKKAPILILDEATSSLDSISEEKIKQATIKLKHEVTQIIVAHRFSTIEHADRIIVIENGVKVGDGTKEYLMETCPIFRSMWEAHYQHKKPKVRSEDGAESIQTV
jgi:ABC-type multidrug transport system fused ATPase/permease subunit